jgi:hypothetical protein
MDLQWVFQQLIGIYGGFFAVCLFIVGCFYKWVVFGWTYSDMREDRDRWREIALSGTKLASRAVEKITK